MIKTIGYRQAEEGIETEFLCYRLGEWYKTMKIITTEWCIDRCPYALTCKTIEQLIRKEDEFGVPDYKKIFIALRYMIADLYD